MDTELTPARGESIESKYPAAKGFLTAADLQAKLKANKPPKDKKTGVAAFDKLARGRWVLFAGPLVNLNEDTFDIGLGYTPQLPNDPMGMSRQFFEVSMSPGYELVSLGVWK